MAKKTVEIESPGMDNLAELFDRTFAVGIFL
jgi:hypothetical protein